MLGALAAEEKCVEDCSATAKPNPRSAFPVGINEKKIDNRATNTPQTVNSGHSPVVEEKYVDIDAFEMNAQGVNYFLDTPFVMAKSVIEQPATPTSKPEIAETVQQNTFPSEDVSGRRMENSPALIGSSTAEPREIAPGFEEEPKPQKNKGKKKKRKSTPKSDAGKSTPSLASKDSSETLKSSFMAESTENFVSALSSPNPSVTTEPLESCPCFTDSRKSIPGVYTTIHQMDTKSSKTNSNASAGSTPTSKSTVKTGKQPRENHSKKGSNSSIVSTGSVRNADMKPAKSGGKKDGSVKPATEDFHDPRKENLPSSPTVNLEDNTQWPSLGTVKTSLALTDGKPHSVPVLQPLIERKKNPNAPIIPVVPLNMQQRRRPS